MVEYIVTIVLDSFLSAIDFALIFYFFSIFMKAKDNKVWLPFLIIFMALISNYIAPSSNPIKELIYFSECTLIGLIFFRAKSIQIIFMSVTYYLSIGIITVGVATLVSNFTEIETSIFLSVLGPRIMLGLFLKLIFGSILLFINKKFKTFTFSYTKKFIMLYINIIIVLMLITDLFLKKLYTNITYNEKLIILFSIIVLLLISFFAFLLAKEFSENNQKISLYKTLLLSNTSNEEYIDDINKKLFEIRKLKHNQENDYIVLLHLIENKEYVEATKFLQEKVVSVGKTAVIDSGNIILNALINQKMQLYCKVEFSYQFNLIEDFEMEKVDFCALIGNLLNNSFEAAEEYRNSGKSDAKVYLEIKSTKTSMLYKLINSAKELDDVYNLRTKKSDKDAHGYGLINISQIVKKYNGIEHRSFENNKFSIIITLQK